MKVRRIIVQSLFLLALCIAATAQEVNVSPDNKNIEYVGRVNFTNTNSPVMVFPGTSINADFTGTSIKMKAKPGSRYFMVKIDESAPRKIDFTGGDSIITLASGLENGSHHVDVMLAYEGYELRPEFRGFVLSEGGKMLPIAKRNSRKIEFIGNSITCGYGSEANDGNLPFSIDTENHYITYAALTARAIKADEMVVARSGIGAYRNYNGSSNGDKDVMPLWYDYTLLYDSTQVWNHKNYEAQIICVNLGTNDLSTKGYKLPLFKSNYKKFVKHLRQLHPQSTIVLLSGCMLHGKALSDQQTTLNAICEEQRAAGDKNIYSFDFTPQDGSLGYGASYHPSKAQHEKMSRELVPFIQKIMKWH